MKLKAKFVFLAIIGLTVLMTSCFKSECDKLYDKIESTVKEMSETATKLRANPTDKELQTKYLNTMMGFKDIVAGCANCNDDKEFMAKLIVLNSEIAKNELKGAELNAIMKGQKYIDDETARKEQDEQMNKLSAEMSKSLKESLENEKRDLAASLAKFNAEQSNSNSDYLTNDELIQIVGSYSGELGNSSITIAIREVSVDGLRVEGYNIVKGNKRPLNGSIKKDADGYFVVLKEPGDEKYDGIFEGNLGYNNGEFKGSWTASQIKTIKNFNVKKTEQ